MRRRDEEMSKGECYHNSPSSGIFFGNFSKNCGGAGKIFPKRVLEFFMKIFLKDYFTIFGV
jgi:hypothetical protein